MGSAIEKENGSVTPQNPLASHKEDELILFIQDKSILLQFKIIIGTLLKFKNITVMATGNNKKEAIEKLSKVLMTTKAHIFVYPSLAKTKGDELKMDIWSNFLLNVKTRIDQTRNDKEKTLNAMSKIIAIMEEAENYIVREKYIRMFASYRIPGVFIFPYAESQSVDKIVKERLSLLTDYLTEHLTSGTSAVEKIKEQEKEMELSEKKDTADKLMVEGRDHQQKRNFEEAVRCFEKAIKIMPDDPEAYLESGRGFTKLQKYGRALGRFSEAEEVSRNQPVANMEIGNVKIAQVKDMVEKGIDPDSDDVKKILSEASASFQTAVDKAEKLTPLHDEDKTDRSAEAISAIAKSISEHSLGETLGAGNDVVKGLHSMVGDALKKQGIDSYEEMSTPNKITLGLISADDGEYEEAEKLLFEAAEDKKYLSDACWGINYLGAQIRQNEGVDEAFAVYKKLLKLDPPNKAAVHFNLAVAYCTKDDNVEASGEIVQAVYTDPGLPHDAMFKKNLKMMELYKKIIKIFSFVKDNAEVMKEKQKVAVKDKQEESVDIISPKPNKEFERYKIKFEQMIKTDRVSAIKALYALVNKKKAFFESSEIFSSFSIMSFLKDNEKKMSASANPKAKEFAVFLGEVIEMEKKIVLPTTPQHQAFREKLEAVIKSNRSGASRKLYDLIMLNLGFFASKTAYESVAIMGVVDEAYKRFAKESNPKIQVFVESLKTVIERKNMLAHSATPAGITSDFIKKLISADDTDGAIKLFTTKNESLTIIDSPEFYEDNKARAFFVGLLEKLSGSDDISRIKLSKTIQLFLDESNQYEKFKEHHDKALKIYMETMDQRMMVNYIAKATISFPKSVEKPFFYEDSELVNASFEIHKKLVGEGIGDSYK